MSVARKAAVFVMAAVVVVAGGRAAERDASAPHGPVAAEVSVCFVPQQECDVPVAAAIGQAKTFIRVQAYGFSSPVVLRALAEARARWVDVQAILDKSDDRVEADGGRPRVGGARFTVAAGIPTWIDSSVAIAHSKVIIIDGHLVIGGSYNYTAAAERRNAENVTFIDAPVVADFYLVNWEARKAVSRPSRFMAEDGPGRVASGGGRSVITPPAVRRELAFSRSP